MPERWVPFKFLVLGFAFLSSVVAEDDHNHHDAKDHDKKQCAHCASHGQSTIAWSSSLEESLKAAKESSRLVLIDFGAEWCGWCKKLDRETFGNAEVIRFVKEHFVALRVDVDKTPALKAEFQVDGLPTLLFLAPVATDDKGGAPPYQILGRIKGFRPPELFLEEARKLTLQGSSLKELGAAAESAPLDAGAQRAYARALRSGGHLDEAEFHLKKAVKRIPLNGALTFELGEIQRQRGRFEVARDLFTRGLGYENTSSEIQRETAIPLARCLISLENPAEAETVLGKLLADLEAEKSDTLRPLLLEALFLRGYVRSILEKPAEALADLRKAREVDPEGEWGFRASFVITRLEN